MRILLAVLLGLLLSSSLVVAAPPLSQRSPLRSGLWWDPQHSGHGFDIHVSGRDVGLLWYTYREDGEPVWYFAGGQLDAAGELRGELLEARWSADGLRSTAVGSVQLTRLHNQAAQLQWRIGERQGGWTLQPFHISGQRAESDPSGAYYEPSRSGFGLSVEQQAHTQSAIYYAFDADNRPQWWLGVRDATASIIEFTRFRGACPHCVTGAPQPAAALQGQLRLDGTLAELQLDDPLGLLPAEFRQLDRPLRRFTPARNSLVADFGLAYFDSATELKRFLDIGLLSAELWQSPGSVDYSPPPVASALNISPANRVVAGVDEPDHFKNDGRYLYAFATSSGGTLSAQVRIAEILGEGPHIAARGGFALREEAERMDRRELYLSDQRLATVSSTVAYSYYVDLCPPPPYEWLNGQTQVEIYDRSNPLAPRPIWMARIDGHLVDSRRIGDQLYLVQRYSSLVPGFHYGSSHNEEVAQNRALLENTPLANLLPQIRVGLQDPQPLLAAHQVLLPPSAERSLQPDLAVVTRINLDDPADRESLAVIGGAEAIHVSENAIYLTLSRSRRTADYQSLLPPRYDSVTDIHRITLAGGGLQADASGSIDGNIDPDSLRQPFRLSEHQGKLRVMSYGDFAEFGRNRLSVLEPSTLVPGLLRTVATLPNAQAPTPIGKPNETLYATRFVGDRLYAVTYRQVDPLYVIDLADPAAPAIRGELTLPGFSDYLHPLEGGLLLGVGYDAAGDMVGGLKLALFDVADAAQPRLLDSKLIGERGTRSALFRSHHAFSSLPIAADRWRLALPAWVVGEPEPSGISMPDTQQTWTHGGLYVYDVIGQGRATRLEKFASMVTSVPGQTGDPYAAAYSARSLLLPTGAIYLEYDDFWTAPWDDLAHPVGPQ